MKNTPQFYLAPLRGVTDVIFRNTFENHFGKFNYLLAPFIPTVKGTYINPSHIRDIDPQHNDTDRLIPQIIGNDATDIVTLANHMASLGYRSVNLNLGCPHPQITRKKRGSGLLPYPEMIKTLLDQIMSEIKCSFSVKVRLGLLSSTDLEMVIPVLNQFALSEVIIHPRTGAQMYDGIVDLESFRKY
jgi:tRNA-dihydrouridine synthase